MVVHLRTAGNVGGTHDFTMCHVMWAQPYSRSLSLGLGPNESNVSYATRDLVEVLFVSSCSNGLKQEMCVTFLDAWTVRLGGSNCLVGFSVTLGL